MFCDYCHCNDCKYGARHLFHAQTINDTWICDVCYTYEVCLDAPERKGKGLCKDDGILNCHHKPDLKSSWIKFNENKKD